MAESQSALYVRAESFQYSPATAIASFAKDWAAPLEDEPLAIAKQSLEVGLQKEHWQFFALQRADLLYRFDPQTLRFTALTHTKAALTPGQHYHLSLETLESLSRGVGLAYTFNVSSALKGGVRLQLLKSERARKGSLTGTATAVGTGDYDFQFDSDFSYAEDPLFERGRFALDGRGYSGDLFLQWLPLARLTLQLQVKDLFSRLRFKDMPFTTAQSSSLTKSFDSDGYLVYLPVAQGLEGFKDTTFEFETDTQLLIQRRLNHSQALKLYWQRIGPYRATTLGWTKTLSENQKFGLEWNHTMQALGLSWQSPLVAFKWLSDSLDRSKAKAQQFHIALHWPF